MSEKSSHRIAWLALFVLLVVTFLIVATPVYLIQPFAAQTEGGIGVSYILKKWSPYVTVLCAAVALSLAVSIWKRSRRIIGRFMLLMPLGLIAILTWFSYQNHFEWMFNPLAEPRFVRASDANFVAPDDMVLAVNINGDAVAFPVRLMAYHHVVQEVVGGTPITATY